MGKSSEGGVSELIDESAGAVSELVEAPEGSSGEDDGVSSMGTVLLSSRSCPVYKQSQLFHKIETEIKKSLNCRKRKQYR
mgnify:CR=1 FL=1